MRPEYILALGLVLLVIWALADSFWRKDWPTSWLDMDEPEPPATPEPNYYMRDVNPREWSQPAAKGFKHDEAQTRRLKLIAGMDFKKEI